MDQKTVHDRLMKSAMDLIQKRLDKLEARKFVLFPWLRRKWLMRKYAKAVKLLG